MDFAEIYQTATPWSEASKREVARLNELIAHERVGERVKPSRGDEGAVDPAGWFQGVGALCTGAD